MQGWQTPYLGLRELPREISAFELQAFFSFGPAEKELIERRRGDRGQTVGRRGDRCGPAADRDAAQEPCEPEPQNDRP